MTALIVEDEKMAREHLARILTERFPDFEVIGTTSSVKDTLETLRGFGDKQPDVIFMDVELSDGECFEIFRQFSVSSSVIMTTAYDSYALKAFEAGSVDYLLKPIDISALDRAVTRCRERERKDFDLDLLLKAFGRTPSYKERFVVHIGDNVIPVRTADIACFYSEDKFNHVVTISDKADYIIDASMDSIERELDPKAFFRISRGVIVAMNIIKSVCRQGGGRLQLKCDTEAPCELTVSRSRVNDFLAWLE